jgi:ElaB/YqjD/DUF883 family membrane-anchored ribosome-binding protein
MTTKIPRKNGRGTPVSSATGPGEALASAGAHLQQAARAAADSVRSAALQALSEGHDAVAPELAAAGADTRQAGIAMKRATAARIDALRNQGAATVKAGEDWVRAHPLAAVGVAVAGGWLLSRLLRR